MADQKPGEASPSVRLYLVIYVALMLLFILTAILSKFDLGRFNLILALGIAAAKAVLVLLFFMHLRYDRWLTWVFASAGVIWLGIMFALTMSDYATRGLSPFIFGR